ncbi:FliO/MopB family protein [Gimesia aquarii]|uniref:Flagellar biosynthesis protein, FliO n=1 Tax=Gimesia aquarii TaxID=2527964 RepID=A0A517VZ68_9PLAN|nr:flagellar biosynthetic protein FliO [Gimesia aquarii]QDT98308.1 hypothetical protein V144x_37940 [Gimesia aquarii]
MIRFFYLSGLILVCSMHCLSSAMSEDVNSSARNNEFRKLRANINETQTYKQQSRHIIAQRTQGRGAVPSASNQFVQPVTSRSARVTKIKADSTNDTNNKARSNPITPVDRQTQNANGQNGDRLQKRAPSLWGTLGALFVVISIILVCAKIFKKHSPLASKNLPREVMEVLGKRPLDARQTIHFVRCGSRILILGSSPAGLEMLSEVLDPVEVDLITGMCREREQAERSNSTFLNLFQSTQNKPDQNGQDRAVDRFKQYVRTEPEQPARSPEHGDYNAAVSRLQQKLLHTSRQSVNESSEPGHA